MVQLYTANHTVKTGIQDLVKVILLAGKAHSVQIELSDALTSRVVIIIDEFSSSNELRKLLKTKAKRNIRYALVSTEFETNGNIGTSFNEFAPTSKYLSVLVSWTSFLIYYTPKCIRGGRILGKLIAFLASLPLLPTIVLASDFKWTNILDRLRAFKRAAYMKARRRGYDKFRSHADLIVNVHERLTQARTDNILYPVLSRAAPLTNHRIKVSGTQSLYRINMCNKFLRRLTNKNEVYIFEYDGSINFDTESNENLYGFAYQPAQSESWDKSNPIKIWRDYYLHGSLPIVDTKFGDHPIEGVAITTSQFFANEFNDSLVRNSVAEYNKMVFANNEKIFIKLLILQDNR